MDQDEQNYTRRDVLYYAAGTAGAVTVGAAIWPLAAQMNASADVRALSKINVDISSIAEGAQLVVEWKLKPVFIRHRTPEEIEMARADDGVEFRDPTSENANKPDADASDANRALDEEGKWLVAVGLCTHLGCVPTVNLGDYNGWYCPCHGSHYDTSGRLRKGPAPRNLDIPPTQFISDSVIQIG